MKLWRWLRSLFVKPPPAPWVIGGNPKWSELPPAKPPMAFTQAPSIVHGAPTTSMLEPAAIVQSEMPGFNETRSQSLSGARFNKAHKQMSAGPMKVECGVYWGKEKLFADYEVAARPQDDYKDGENSDVDDGVRSDPNN